MIDTIVDLEADGRYRSLSLIHESPLSGSSQLCRFEDFGGFLFVFIIYKYGWLSQLVHTLTNLWKSKVNGRVNPPMALMGLNPVTIGEQTQCRIS